MNNSLKFVTYPVIPFMPIIRNSRTYKHYSTQVQVAHFQSSCVVNCGPFLTFLCGQMWPIFNIVLWPIVVHFEYCCPVNCDPFSVIFVKYIPYSIFFLILPFLSNLKILCCCTFSLFYIYYTVFFFLFFVTCCSLNF